MPGPPPPPPPPLPPLPSFSTQSRTLSPPPPPPPILKSKSKPPTQHPPRAKKPTIHFPSPPPPPPAPPAPPSVSSYRVRMSNLPPAPPVAPALPASPRMSDEAAMVDAKFPSFTMELTPDLADITNVESGGKWDRVDSIRPGPGRSDLVSRRGNSGRGISGPRQWERELDFEKMESAQVQEENGEEEGEELDVPDRLTMGAGAAAARLDLQRCTMRVHKQLVEKIQTNSMKPARGETTLDGEGEEMSRCQGELWVKSRVAMMGWKKRYGSIIDHAYFGPVLFLFRYDGKGNVALQHSMMIVLVDCCVRLGRNSKSRNGDYRCEFVLKTTKRRYVIAANHTMRRDYWLRHLESIQHQSASG